MITHVSRFLLPLQAAFSRKKTFFVFSSILVGMCFGTDDVGGVGCIVRALCLGDLEYRSFLHFFFSNAVDFVKLQNIWVNHVHSMFQDKLVSISGRSLYILDATNADKSGRRMPAVRSSKKDKDEWVRGHFTQHLGALARGAGTFFFIPLFSDIQGGFEDGTEKNRVDRCIDWIKTFEKLAGSIFVADSWYAKSKIILSLAAERKIALISRVAQNAVAWNIPNKDFQSSRRGRPRKYGEKVKLHTLFDQENLTPAVITDSYGKETEVFYWVKDLIWRPVGLIVRFVGCMHPEKGRIILISSDISISPQEIIQAYSFRFWIEVGFHHGKSFIGGYKYRFWSKYLPRIGWRYNKDWNIEKLSKKAQIKANEKMRAYNRFTFTAGVAQTILAYLSLLHCEEVIENQNLWIRTLRSTSPSIRLASSALQNSVKSFFCQPEPGDAFEKFLWSRAQSSQRKFEMTKISSG